MEIYRIWSQNNMQPICIKTFYEKSQPAFLKRIKLFSIHEVETKGRKIGNVCV